jgi:hypothetical protein
MGMHKRVTQPQRLPTALGILLALASTVGCVISLARPCKRKTQSARRIDAPWL